MKKLTLVLTGLLAVIASMPSQAATASSTFNVVINLTSACTISTPANLTMNYTAGGAAVTATTSANVNCTNTLPYTLSMNGTIGAGKYALTDAATGLNYTLAFNGTGTGGADATGVGAGATASVVTIGANIAAGQWGTCATAACTNGAGVVQTVYVNY